MAQNRRFAERWTPRISAARRGMPEDRLPTGTAVAIVAGVNAAFWLLIVFTLDHLLF